MKFFNVFALLVVLTSLSMAGCDEGVDVVKPVMMEGTEETEPVEQPTEPEESTAEVIEISYYRDSNLTMPLTDSVEVGSIIYTKVVFSKEVPVVIADDESARPSIFFRIEPKSTLQTPEMTQCRIRSSNVPHEDLQSGDAKQHQDTNTFICKYIVQTKDFGETFLTSSESYEGDLLRIILFTYVPESTEHNPAVQHNQEDFVGLVCTPKLQPVFGAVVTIMSGPQSGESVITNRSGQYTFRDVTENELHLLVEKEFFETKEVLVYRDRQTILANGNIPNFRNRPKTPGTVLIGQRWPEKIKPILQQLEKTLGMYDLLYYEDPSLPETSAGRYRSTLGIIQMNGNFIGSLYTHATREFLNTLAHEIAHARQEGVLIAGGDTSGDIIRWKNTPEGLSFAKAREKDWEEYGKPWFDKDPHFSLLQENAAEICAYYWSINQWEVASDQKIEAVAPNRFRWAQEWLNKKY